MKITILWSSLSSYSVAFFRELSDAQHCQLQLIYQSPKSEAPYNQFDLKFCYQALQDSPSLKGKLDRLVFDFAPECVLMSSWPFKHFMKLTKKLRKQGVLVISSMDNQWRGTVKQRLGILLSRWFLKHSIDTFLVAGDRQADFARKLGYDKLISSRYRAYQSIEIRKRRITKSVGNRKDEYKAQNYDYDPDAKRSLTAPSQEDKNKTKYNSSYPIPGGRHWIIYQ